MAYVLSKKELVIINDDPMTFLRNLISVGYEHIILHIFMYIMNHKLILDLNTIKDENCNNFLHILCTREFIYCEVLIGLIIYTLENNYIDTSSKNINGNTFLHKLSQNDGIVLLHVLEFIIKNNLIDISTKNNYGNNFLWIFYNKKFFTTSLYNVVNCIKDNKLEPVYFYCDNSKCLIHDIFNEIDKNELCDEEDEKLYDYLLEEYNKTSSLTKSSKKNDILYI